MTTDLVFGGFDFGLSAADEARARSLHTGALVVDLLMAGPCGYRSFDAELTAEAVRRLDASDPTFSAAVGLPLELASLGRFPDYEACWRGSGITAAAVGMQIASPVALDAAALDVERRARLPWLRQARSVADILDAHAAGDAAFFLNCQPVEPISDDLALLDGAIELGLRMLMLTYNRADLVGTGCTEGADAGLSRFGVEVVERLNERGILVDTAHCSHRTTLDACAVSDAPVVASHVGASRVFQHARNKDDDELEAIARTGGLVGVYALPVFLGPGQPTVSEMLDHVDHIARAIGPESIAIGTDWPMQLPKEALRQSDEAMLNAGFRPEDNLDDELNLVGFDDYRDFINITRGLVARGYSDEEIAGILGGNALRVFERVWR